MKYRNFFNVFLALFLCVGATSCSSEEDDEVFTPATLTVSGKVEKGPFVSGSTITIQPMNEDLQVMGTMYSTTINDDLGNFVLGSKEFQAPYAELMANGYFFNEVRGELSEGTLTLRALVDLSDKQTVNVNVLTHLKYARIKNLIASGISFKQANTQAQKELLTAFGLQGYSSKDASQFSIMAGTDESAVLIIVSSLLLMDRSEAALTEYLAKLSEDFGQTGTLSESNQRQINSDKAKLVDDLTCIKEHIIRRYEDLGLNIEVKDLAPFFDWDGNGTVGDELLKEGEQVKLETTELNVPNEGGVYTIKINSPISVYLRPQIVGDGIVGGKLDVAPTDSVITETFWSSGLYEGIDNASFDAAINCEIILENKVLTINIASLNSKTDKKKSILLYDYIGNIVGTLTIRQEAGFVDIPVTDIPLLGNDGQNVVAGIAKTLAMGISNYSVVEQYYHYNKLTNLVSRINPSNSYICNAWENIYRTNAQLLNLKKADELELNVYGHFCNVLSALYYSNLLYAWGDVPYYIDYSQQESAMNGLPRTPQQEILSDLQSKLTAAIDFLEEKKNESVKDINGFFFVSKDVARVLLANLYMYEGKHSEAIPLLEKVIDNGFYQLDASTNFMPSTETSVTRTDITVQNSTEVIYALLGEASGTRTNVTILYPGVMPYITLSDVYLSLAECRYHIGDLVGSEKCIDEIVQSRGIGLTSGSILSKIVEIRKQLLLYSGTYFAFLKRNGLVVEECGVEDFRQLWPIPYSEMGYNPSMVQNPGY